MMSKLLPKNERISLSWPSSLLRIVSLVRFLEEVLTLLIASEIYWHLVSVNYFSKWAWHPNESYHDSKHPKFAIWSHPQKNVQKIVPRLYSLVWKVQELQFHTFLYNKIENAYPGSCIFKTFSYPTIMWILKKYLVKSLVHKSNNWSMSGTFKHKNLQSN